MAAGLTADDYGILDNANEADDRCIRYDLNTAPSQRIEQVAMLTYEGEKLFARVDKENPHTAIFQITQAGIDVLASREAP